MTQDLIEGLRTLDPARDGVDVPPVESLLALIAAQTPPEPPRRRRISARVAAVGCSIAVVVTALTLAVTGRAVDVAAEARAALEPQGYIIHTVTSTTLPDSTSGPRRHEEWIADDPVRRRSLSTLAPTGRGRAQTVEMDYANGVTRFAMSGDNTIRMSTAPAARPKAILQPAITQTGPDPVTSIRRLLADGSLTPAGEMTLAGRRLLRLTGRQASIRMRVGGRMAPLRIEYLVDPDTSAPVQVTSWALLAGAPDVMVLRTTFETYERIALTGETARLLRISDAAKRKVRRR